MTEIGATDEAPAASFCQHDRRRRSGATRFASLTTVGAEPRSIDEGAVPGAPQGGRTPSTGTQRQLSLEATRCEHISSGVGLRGRRSCRNGKLALRRRE